MVALVSVETVLLVLLVLLVAGLLRSHAEILRRLGPPREAEAAPSGGLSPDLPAPPPARPPEERAAPIAGLTPDGDAVAIDFEGTGRGPTLLAFLTTGCTACAGFWQELRERRLPDVQTVIVTHGSERERPSRLRSLAPPGVPVVMSSPAFADYRVSGSPYFVLVDGSIRGEGSASTWEAVTSLVADALADEREARGGAGRAEQVDAILAAAGIGPGHPSLYPDREERP